MDKDNGEPKQELEVFLQQAQQARQEGDLPLARKFFLQAAEVALLMAEKEKQSALKKKHIHQALKYKELAQRVVGSPAPVEEKKEEPDPSPSGKPEENPLPSGENPPSPEEEVSKISEGTAEDWSKKGREAEGRGETKEAKKAYLKAAEAYYLLAGQTKNNSYLSQARHFKNLAQDVSTDLPPELADYLREAREEEGMGKLAEEEGDIKAAKIHYLKATEKLLKIADHKDAPKRDLYLQQALGLKKKADSLGKTSLGPKDLTDEKDSPASQPMRAEFLLKRSEEYERKGLDARDEGNKKKALFYLTKAADFLRQLADLSSDKLGEARLERAKRLEEIVASLDGKKQGSPLKQAEKDTDSEEQTFFPVEKPQLKFSDIAGLEDVKEEVRRKMILPFQYPEQAEKFGVKKGGGILLYGPPGTGKTMIAQAIAAEIEAVFFTVRPSEIMSKWVGEAEKNINNLFNTARQQERSIIFIDEIEAMVPARRDSASNVMQRLVPQILAELEGFGTSKMNPLLFLGATNEPWDLDPAVLRPGRFDEKIYVGLPDRPAILKLLEMNLGDKPLEEDIDFEELADYMTQKHYSGADVKNICIKACTDAFVASIEGQEPEDVKITMGHILRVIQKTRSSVTDQDLNRFKEYASSH